ncbi:ATP-dependent RNA helicase drs1; AltName: Full=DEAD box RNA helicase 11 [Serendipita indica DSM 11827]|nr:ATP-dependent RNA helicase drs1; AltName: Full=DEAD box RNA helicase 11 [Serendipita indica DSM 11827]
MDDLIRTLDSDVEVESEEEFAQSKGRQKRKEKQEDAGGLNPEFVFDLTDATYGQILSEHASLGDVVNSGTKPQPISVDDIIARRKVERIPESRKRKREEDSEDESVSDDESEIQPDGSSESESQSPKNSSQKDEEDEIQSDAESSSEEEEEETEMDKERKAAFFAAEEEQMQDMPSTFLTMNLSRPIMKSLTSLSFHTPTPIQAATIPVALLGKDIVGNAVTGSGKTAAFMIPILERLLYRQKGKNAAATRCLVLVPTRELAVQCFEVGTKLAAHTDIQISLVVGGLSLKAQEATLRSKPDLVIATPGRLIDHLRNSPTFNLDALDVLVLDEADRMLSDGFADELEEIVKSCPRSRQTMLFSATMTDSVDELVKMSLNKPVRLFVDPKRATAKGLVQEFVRVKAGRESERAAILVTLCKRTFRERVIIFFRSKKLAHQMRIMFGLLDMRADELHGDLTQEQRLTSLQAFRDGKVDYLMATDLASRGLDIKGIETVINYDMPGQLAQYLHRVGRTARAGKNGRSVTLVGEADRKMLKAAIKHGSSEDKVRHRLVPAEVVEKWSEQIGSLQDEIQIVLDQEKEAKQMRQAEMELQKGENMLKYEDEIFSRPARTWFQTSKEKEQAQEKSRRQYEAGLGDNKAAKVVAGKATIKPKRDKFAGLSRKAKRRKLAQEEDAQIKDSVTIKASIREAKKAQRPTRIGLPEGRKAGKEKRGKAKAIRKKTSTKLGKGLGFSKDAAETSRRGREGARASKTDAIGRPKQRQKSSKG